MIALAALRQRLIRLHNDRRGFEVIFEAIISAFIFFIWIAFLLSVTFFVEAALNGSLVNQGLAQMVELLPQPSNTSASQSALNGALGALTANSSPILRCHVDTYTFTPSNSGPTATVSLNSYCQLDALAFGLQTVHYQQTISIYYAHVIN